MTPSTKCPKCGANRSSPYLVYLHFECGSYDDGAFKQSGYCEHRELKFLRTSLEKAKEALKPFADLESHPDMTEEKAPRFLKLVRRASAVLKEISEESPLQK